MITREEKKRLAELRRQAELVVDKPINHSDESLLSQKEAQRLVHELRVHQIELEMQNREMQASNIALEESRDRFSELYDFSPVGYLTLGPNGMILEANLACSNIFNVNLQNLIGKPITGFVDQKDGDILYFHFKRVFETSLRQTCDIRILKKDNTSIPVRLESVIFRDSDGSPKGLRTAVIDITERKKSEESLSASELRYRRLFESTQEGILILDFNTGKILDVNPHLIDMLGYSHEEFLDKYIWEVGPLKDMNLNKEAFSELKSKGYVHYEDLPLETKDKQSIAVEVVSNSYQINRETFIQCNIRDITRRKQAEIKLKEKTDALEQSNKDLEHFASVAAHDLREPLIGTAAYLKIIDRLTKDTLKGKPKEYLFKALETVIRMDWLVQGLLSYSCVTKTKQEPEPTNCNECLSQSLDNLSVVIEESNAAISVSDLPIIMANPLHITQLFQNLLGNALKFRSERPLQIEIGVESSDTEHVLWVRDNGTGIERPHFDRIFQIFQRIEKDSGPGGTGIGLATCKKIAEKYGGRLWVESELDKGSIFYFTFPIYKKEN